jgi:hypothetical protein
MSKPKKKEPELRIAWQDFPMSDVVSAFISSLKLKNEEEKITSHEWYYDPEKKTLILQMFITSKGE